MVYIPAAKKTGAVTMKKYCRMKKMRLYGFFFADKLRAMYPTTSKARPTEKVMKYQDRWRMAWKRCTRKRSAKRMAARMARAKEGVYP
jgi:hypothetical protein